MLKHVTLALNSLDPTSWTQHDVENLCDFLKQQFPAFPDTGHIYHGEVCQENDVTPSSEEDIERLLEMPGPFFVVIYPGSVVLLLVAVIAVAAYTLTATAAVPLVPAATARNSQTASPNNELSDRSNQARINGRIPDIYGIVRSTPDLIAAPYKVFENNVEVEYAYMCIGRGAYDVSDIRDDTTLIVNIPGSRVEVYEPYTSPNSGDAPQLRIGSPINKRVINSKRAEGVNGQVLRPPNTSSVTGVNNIYFAGPNVIRAFYDADIDFSNLFVNGDILTITNASVAAVTGGTIIQNVTIYMLYGIPAEDYYYAIYEDIVANGDPEGTAAYFLDLSQWAGSFIIQTVEETVPPSYAPGKTIVIDQTNDPVDLFYPPLYIYWNFEGTYTILDSRIFVDTEGKRFLQVKLTDPGTVNGYWNFTTRADNGTIYYASGSDNLLEAFKFDLTLEFDNTTGYDLAGTYTAVSVTSKELTLDSPADINADWNVVTISPALSPTIASSGDRWIGPFIIDVDDANEIICNFVAQNGLYKDNGTDQYAETVNIQVSVQQVDASDVPTAIPVVTTGTFLLGSSTLKETVAKTLRFSLSSFIGRCSIKARRISESDEVFEGNVVDEVRWRDLYSIAPVTQEDFGNVTTVQSVTLATASALAIKERKLNLLATRKIPIRVSGSVFTETLTASTDAAEIFSAICLDQYIGRRAFAELDFDNIYDTVDAIETYFGTDKVRKFSYTFDSDNLSFEETVTQVADALFCVAYRRGNVIRLSFEKETADSTLLFNHRNKIPKTETRSVTFGNGHEFDGLEYTYVNPSDDSIISIFLPPGYSAANPKKVESIGVRDHLQAFFLAWRIWNKILYQNTTIEFDATQEADLLVRNDRILVADGTRPYTQDGEVVAVDSLELTLSQNVDLTVYASYVIWLQHIDGVAESIAITAGTASNKVVLAGAPRLALVTDIDKYARTAYVIIGDTEAAQTAFLVTDRDPQDNMTSTVKARNYDVRYYAHDTDFINDLIDENGYGPVGGYVPGTGTGWPPPDVSYVFLNNRTFLVNGYEESNSPSLRIYTMAQTQPFGKFLVAKNNEFNSLLVDDSLIAGEGESFTWASTLEWWNNASIPPDGVYEIRVTRTNEVYTGSPTFNGVYSTWLPLDNADYTAFGWMWDCYYYDTDPSSYTADWIVEIRNATTLVVLATATWSIILNANAVVP